MKPHPFDAYFSRHDHYPRVRIDNGSQRLLIEFAPGYARVKTYPQGSEIYITRSAFFNLLRRAVPLAKAWASHADVDVSAQTHAYLEAERAHSEELRRQKRERHRTLEDQERSERKRRRFLKARARSQRD